MLKSMMKKNYRKKLTRSIERWLVAQQQFAIRKQRADRLEWVLRQLERDGDRQASLDGVIKKIQNIREKSQKRTAKLVEADYNRRIEAVKKVGGDPDKIKRNDMMIPDDIPLVCNQAIDVITELVQESLEKTPEDIVPFLKEAFERERMGFNDHMEFMIAELQIELEKVKYYLCPQTRPLSKVFKPDPEKEADTPDWAKAGDILMPAWEMLIETGIKHEICTRVRFFSDMDSTDEFALPEDFKVETREEMSSRLAKAALEDHEIDRERKEHYGE
jgi:hypothetical protein